MTELSFSSQLLHFFLACFLGGFLGLGRESRAQKNGHKEFMGFRTMALISALGVTSTFFPQLTYLPVVFFVGIVLLVGIAYAHGSFAMNRIGMTSETTAMLTFWIGVMVGMGMETMAIIVTLFLATLNTFKKSFHIFAKTLTEKEWKGALELFLVSGAVLPFLPRNPIDPWGVIVPFNVWMLVILISGIGFFGYFFIKFFGVRGGIPLTGFLGSIVSSTAVTTSLASQSKRSNLTTIFTVGIMIAAATMQLRVAGEIALLRSESIPLSFLLIPLSMAGASIACALYYFYVRQSKEKRSWFSKAPSEIKIDSPFEFVPALKFGAIFIFVLLALAVGKKYFGQAGVYAAAALSGFIDIDAIVLSSLEAVKLEEMRAATAQNAITIALFINTIFKVFYVALLGTRDLTLQVLKPILVSAAAGAGVIILLT